ncbi:MAG: amidohydrolase family protein [Planctomycetota bacterium]
MPAFRIIDVHTHAFPDFLAERAVRHLTALTHNAAPPCHDGTLAGLTGLMDRAGVDTAVVCNIATAPAQTDRILAWSRAIRSPRIIPLPSIHPANDRIPQRLAEFKAAGFPGIKLHPMFQEFELDADACRPIYETAAALDLAVMIHTGYDIAFPTSDAAGPRRLARVLDRHPGLRICAAHFGGWRRWDEVLEVLAGREVWFETSFTLGFIAPSLFDMILKRHGIARIMFGSDAPWQDPAVHIGRLRELGLPADDRDAILGGNALAFLNIEGNGIPTAPGVTMNADFLIPAENALALFGVSQARESTIGRFGWLP